LPPEYTMSNPRRQYSFENICGVMGKWSKKLIKIKQLHHKILLLTGSNKNWVTSLSIIPIIQWHNEILS
jgi:hypothetical protein